MSPRLNTPPCTIYRSYRAGLKGPVQLGREISRLRKATPCQGGREGTEVGGRRAEDSLKREGEKIRW
jgi:hypothetical protein